MPKRMTFLVPAILVFLPAVVLLAARTSFAQHATDDCITKPSSAPPQGSHWYFRVDRMVHRQCWYLGPGGAKVRADARQAESPMRLPPPRPISPPIAESLAEATNTGAAPAQITAGKNDADANFIMRWPGPSLGIMMSEPASMSNSAAMSYAEERTTNAPDDMPLIWSVLTPTDLRVAGPQLASAGEPEGMLAILAGALAFATVMLRLTFNRSAARPVGQSNLLDQRRSIAHARRPRERILPAFADRPAAASLVDFIRNSNGATHRSDIACPPPRPRDSDHAIEESVICRRVARMP
jgi:hypothetical protein